MTPDKTKQAFDTCIEIINGRILHAEPTRLPASSKNPSHAEAAQHCLWMAEEGKRLVEAGRTEKAMRWLGFIQGALWGLGTCAIEELKTMNRPEETAPESP